MANDKEAEFTKLWNGTVRQESYEYSLSKRIFLADRDQEAYHALFSSSNSRFNSYGVVACRQGVVPLNRVDFLGINPQSLLIHGKHI